MGVSGQGSFSESWGQVGKNSQTPAGGPHMPAGPWSLWGRWVQVLVCKLGSNIGKDKNRGQRPPKESRH